MAKGFISIHTSKSGRTEYYTRKEECDNVLIYNYDKAKEFYKFEDRQGSKTNQLFKHIEKYEKKIRVDARVKTTLIVSLPNDVKMDNYKEWTKQIQKEFFEFVPVSFCLHKGENGEVKQNKHCHIIFSERDLNTGKKDRKYNNKNFVQNVSKSYKKHFGLEVEENQENKRERIDTYLWKSDSTFARQQIKNMYSAKIEQEEKPKEKIIDKIELVVRKLSKEVEFLRHYEEEVNKYIKTIGAKKYYTFAMKEKQMFLDEITARQSELQNEINKIEKSFFGNKKKLPHLKEEEANNALYIRGAKELIDTYKNNINSGRVSYGDDDKIYDMVKDDYDFIKIINQREKHRYNCSQLQEVKDYLVKEHRRTEIGLNAPNLAQRPPSKGMRL